MSDAYAGRCVQPEQPCPPLAHGQKLRYEARFPLSALRCGALVRPPVRRPSSVCLRALPSVPELPLNLIQPRKLARFRSGKVFKRRFLPALLDDLQVVRYLRLAHPQARRDLRLRLSAQAQTCDLDVAPLTLC